MAKESNLTKKHFALLVTAYAYYSLHISIVSDVRWDKLARSVSGETSKSIFGYAFNDFDGSTGYHLFSALTDHHKQIVSSAALIIIDINHVFGGFYD